MFLRCQILWSAFVLANGPLLPICLQSWKRICIDSSLYSINMREYFSTSLICNSACQVFYKSNPAVSDWCVSIFCPSPYRSFRGRQWRHLHLEVHWVWWVAQCPRAMLGPCGWRRRLRGVTRNRAFVSGRSHGLKRTVRAARWQIQFG